MTLARRHAAVTTALAVASTALALGASGTAAQATAGSTSAPAAMPSAPNKLATRDLVHEASQRLEGGSPARTTAVTAEAATTAPASDEPTTAGFLDCATVLHATLQDRVVLFTGGHGASTVAVVRQRAEGRRILLTTVPGTRATVVDRAIAHAANPSYELTFTYADSTAKTCPVTTSDSERDDLLLGATGLGAAWAGAVPSAPQRGEVLASRWTAFPTASADGRWIAYSAMVDGTGDYDLFVRRADGAGSGQPLPSTDGDDIEASFSPDGRYLAHTVADPSTGDTTGLAVIDLVTGTVTDVPGSAALAEPAWLTDGRLLATDLSSEAAPLVRVTWRTGARSVLPGSAGAWSPEVSDYGRIAYADVDPTSGRVRVRRNLSGTISTATILEPDHTVFDLSTSHHTRTDNSTTGAVALFMVEADSVSEYGFNSMVRVVEQNGSSEAWGYGWQGVTTVDARRVLSTGTSDLTGDGLNDLLARDAAGVLWTYPNKVGGDTYLGSRVRVGAGWQVMTQFLAAGDLTADGRGDVLAKDRSGVLWVYPGLGSKTTVLGTRLRVGGGWGAYHLVGTGDMNGDTLADIMARDSGGTLWLYPGTGSGGRGGVPAFGTRIRVGAGWNVMNALVGAGDANYDGRPDVFARDRSTGVLWLYPGNGRGAFGTRVRMSSGWGMFTAFAGVENTPFENSPVCLMVRGGDGSLDCHYSMGDGSMDANLWWHQSNGWNTYTIGG
jgi:hypothetical protein